jgi:ABC-type transporter Mla subunit MlaD
MRRSHGKVYSPLASCYPASMSSESDNNLLNFIANTVEALRGRVDEMRVRIDEVSDQMATKVDLANLRDEMAGLRSQMATKDDLARVESGLGRVQSTLDAKTTAIRGDIEQVHIRLDSIDRGVDTRMGQIETDVSRLRSVVYLLVKDKPDMLRLLGQTAPRENLPQG